MVLPRCGTPLSRLAMLLISVGCLVFGAASLSPTGAFVPTCSEGADGVDNVEAVSLFQTSLAVSSSRKSPGTHRLHHTQPVDANSYLMLASTKRVGSKKRGDVDSHPLPSSMKRVEDKDLNHAVRSLIVCGFLLFASLGVLDWYRFCTLPATALQPGAAALLGGAGLVAEKAKETMVDRREAPQKGDLLEALPGTKLWNVYQAGDQGRVIREFLNADDEMPCGPCLEVLWPSSGNSSNVSVKTWPQFFKLVPAVFTTPHAPEEVKELPEWSFPGLVALTSYRFYTGFLSATWLPYLLAMEGADLYKENQSLFMGVAKLIYGLTILTNPLFGLLGDRAIAFSHGIGRRLFLRSGIVISGIGICICVLADKYRYFYCFVFGILLWRIGEALNDVTTEALVPELVPQSQYGVASAAKATSFLLGGLLAYVLLIFMTDYHYSWLYWFYAMGMLIFAVPCQLLLSNDLPMRNKRERQTDPWRATLYRAYIAPAYIAGYFPQLCFGIFLFALGTSPMFFLLLMLRDLVGADTSEQLQVTFSTSSIIFFISAAVATILGGLSDKFFNQPNSNPTPGARIQNPAILISRLQTVMKVAIAYAITCCLMPLVSLFHDHSMRIRGFYFCALLLGFAFGTGFARFQDITWQLIPPNVDVANAMGFNIMCRLFGIGVGNFFAGVLLDFFLLPLHDGNGPEDWDKYYHRLDTNAFQAQSSAVYRPSGYFAMCGLCSVVCLLSAWICSGIVAGVQRDLKEAPVPAA